MQINKSNSDRNKRSQSHSGQQPESTGGGDQKEYDFLVFIGRFQPFHLGHLAVVRQGLAMAGQLIILCGSAHQPRTVRNPWTVAEREQMIRSTLGEAENERVKIAPLMDTPYNDDLWVRNVQAMVQGLVIAHHPIPHRSPRIGLIGHSKDQSSFYLNLFPQWGSVNVSNSPDLSATTIRDLLFRPDETSGATHQGKPEWSCAEEVSGKLAAPVLEFLTEFVVSQDFAFLQEEQTFMSRYLKSWQAAPYAPIFVTVDAVVVQSGHILLVERKARPGKGLFALPGGFVDPAEKLLDACLRELREETRLKVPGPVLRGSISKQAVFDDPYRSARGRTITHAFHIELEPQSTLPKVKGGDDARQAFWLPLAELNPAELFEDHYFIIQHMTGM